jgi:hypothetical protein
MTVGWRTAEVTRPSHCRRSNSGSRTLKHCPGVLGFGAVTQACLWGQSPLVTVLDQGRARSLFMRGRRRPENAAWALAGRRGATSQIFTQPWRPAGMATTSNGAGRSQLWRQSRRRARDRPDKPLPAAHRPDTNQLTARSTASTIFVGPGLRSRIMGNRHWRVRRFFGHSDRLVVLPDDGSKSHDRRASDYDSYERPQPNKEVPKDDALPVIRISDVEKRTCSECGRLVRYNLNHGYYYSHTLPSSAKTCSQSGRP